MSRFWSGGMLTYHGYHKTPLTSGDAGLPVVTYAEDILAQHALTHV